MKTCSIVSADVVVNKNHKRPQGKSVCDDVMITHEEVVNAYYVSYISIMITC